MLVLQIPASELAEKNIALYFVLAFAIVITYLAKLYRDKIDSDALQRAAQIKDLQERHGVLEGKFENYLLNDRVQMQHTLERNTEVLEQVIGLLKKN